MCCMLYLFTVGLHYSTYRTTADSHIMPMEPVAGMLLLFKWRTLSHHHPQHQWVVYQFSSLYKFRILSSHLVWLLQHLWEPLQRMVPALLLEALTHSKSLLEVEEMMQCKSWKKHASTLKSYLGCNKQGIWIMWIHDMSWMIIGWQLYSYYNQGLWQITDINK